MSKVDPSPSEQDVLEDDLYWELYEEMYRITRSEPLVRWQVGTDIGGTGIPAREIVEMEDSVTWGSEDITDLAIMFVRGILEGNHLGNFTRAADDFQAGSQDVLSYSDPIETRLGDIFEATPGEFRSEFPENELESYMPTISNEFASDWERHVGEQPLYVIGTAEVQLIGQYSFTDETGRQHAVTLGYNLYRDDYLPEWMVCWDSEGDRARNVLQGHNQVWSADHADAVDDIHWLIREITKNRDDPLAMAREIIWW